MLTEDAEFDFGNIEPAAVLGRVMEFEALCQTAGFLRGERLVEGGGCVGVEVVAHQDDGFSFRVVHFKEFFDRFGKYVVKAMEA